MKKKRGEGEEERREKEILEDIIWEGRLTEMERLWGWRGAGRGEMWKRAREKAYAKWEFFFASLSSFFIFQKNNPKNS